ncbi:hypothetical protein BZG36_00042 [Bifiguratus adelaidae]|uniref:Uncharacterized protein n=1 Tax=Bifiguratus adelaidae TaxID=1938954 RepID=A0A261Y896_9FUNG|nr:hypothetical protein BZG36_00042 [Bifiguratus adelaidae]
MHGVDCKGLIFTNSTETLGAVESHEQLQSVHTQHSTDTASQTHVPRSTFTDTGPLESSDEGTTANLGSLADNASLVKDTNVNRKPKPRGSYRRYNFDQIEKLFDLVIEEGKTAKDAALITGINIRTAQHYIKRYNDDEERRLPVCNRQPRIGAKDYIDKHPTSILEDIRQKLCEAFT